MPSTFTVYFDDPFWVGLLEIRGPEGVRAARHVFGAEPTGPELLDFSVRGFGDLLDRAMLAPPVVEGGAARPRVGNPKRAARAAARDRSARPVSTAAQEAMSRSYELAKAERRTEARERREAEADVRRERAREKAKARHRGR